MLQRVGSDDRNRSLALLQKESGFLSLLYNNDQTFKTLHNIHYKLLVHTELIQNLYAKHRVFAAAEPPHYNMQIGGKLNEVIIVALKALVSTIKNFVVLGFDDRH